MSIARELLKQGANPNLLNSKGRTALHSAVISANPDMVSLLLNSGADPDVYGNDADSHSALDLALCRWASEGEAVREGGVSDVLELMLQRGVPNDRGSLNETALGLVTQGHLDVVPFLRKQGIAVDPDCPTHGVSGLFWSAAVGDELFEAAELLLQIGADANYRSPQGLPVLSVAVRSGAARIVQALLAAGADAMARNGTDVLAYDLAVIYRHHEIAETLISHMNRVAPEVDKQDSDGNTALMRAVKASDMKTISDLLASGADASRRDIHGESPLSYAVCCNLNETVQLLRAGGVERLAVDAASGEVLIVTAGFKGALGTILDLLDSGVPIDAIDANGDTAFTAAETHPGVVRVLAKCGANVSHRNPDGNTAYMNAAAFNRVLMMQTLKDLGAPIDEPAKLLGPALVQSTLHAMRSDNATDNAGYSNVQLKTEMETSFDALLAASLIGDAGAVSKLIAAGVAVNQENNDGHTALMMALTFRDRGAMSRRRERDFDQVIDSLLVAGADPNRGSIPSLIVATATGRIHLVNALIRAGADINVTAKLPAHEDEEVSSVNALFIALSLQDDNVSIDERIGIALVQAGIDLSFTSEDGTMAAHLAAKNGMAKILREIVSRDSAQINAQDRNGMTPLMMAASSNRVESIRVLLEFHADREIRDIKGRSVFDISMECDHVEITDQFS